MRRRTRFFAIHAPLFLSVLSFAGTAVVHAASSSAWWAKMPLWSVSVWLFIFGLGCSLADFLYPNSETRRYLSMIRGGIRFASKDADTRISKRHSTDVRFMVSAGGYVWSKPAFFIEKIEVLGASGWLLLNKERILIRWPSDGVEDISLGRGEEEFIPVFDVIDEAGIERVRTNAKNPERHPSVTELLRDLPHGRYRFTFSVRTSHRSMTGLFDVTLGCYGLHVDYG